MPTLPRPSFRQPPINEVVCGVQFRPLPLFQAPHYGLFWQTIRKEYPTSRTVLPLGKDAIPVSPNERAEVTFQIGPDFPRVWFISSDEACLIQLQHDRFLFNWRAQDGRNEYPRYPKVIQKFKRHFGEFKEFLKDNALGEPALLGTELSYINNIRPGAGWGNFSEVGEIFPDFSWRRGSRSLPPPEAFNFRSSHAMPAGRLHVAVATAKFKDNSPLIRFDLTARGAVPEVDEGGLWNWYDQANTWIVDAFIDLTSENMQTNVWQRVT